MTKAFLAGLETMSQRKASGLCLTTGLRCDKGIRVTFEEDFNPSGLQMINQAGSKGGRA